MYFPLPLPAPAPSPTNNCQCFLKTPGYQKCHSGSLGLGKLSAFPELAPNTQSRGWSEVSGHPESFLLPPWLRRRGMNVPYVLRV